MSCQPRYLLVSVLAAALLASGCAEHAAKPSAPAGTNAGQAPTTSRTTTSSTSASSNSVHESLPTSTGIPACDDYLASYKGCHAAAGIYAPDTIDKHYREMRDTLLKESRDPSMRSTLAARCVSLAKLLKKALHGKPCEPTPAQPASTSSAP